LARDVGIANFKELAMLRVVFGMDVDDMYEDVEVIIYEYLESLNNVIIYSPNKDMIVFDKNSVTR
jgi:hypothetical protein